VWPARRISRERTTFYPRSRGESGFLPREVVANKEFSLLKRGSFAGG